MPVTFNPLGSTLVVSIIDENFETLESFLRSGVTRDDITGKFTRYQVMRYVGGRLVSATLFADKPRELEQSSALTYDFTYRNTGSLWTTYGHEPERAMELLGIPGPSFYFDWQEDGIDEATYVTPLIDWPPQGWPYSRYPSNVCFSPWLTIPGATVKTWVDGPAVARISATAMGSTQFTPTGWWSFYAVPYDQRMSSTGVANRALHPLRTALIVDTNPILHEDEFVNTNQNIPSDYVSWKNVFEKCFYAAQREQFNLMGEVALKGERYYNFSFKYRAGGLDGYMYLNGDGDKCWAPADGTWYEMWHKSWGKTAMARGNEPTVAASWEALMPNYALGTYILPLASGYTAYGWRPHVVTWENATIHIEFFYGRTTAYLTDSSDPEFD